MTDPAPSPPAGQPPVPVRPMPRLGHGVHWPAIIAEIEADQRARDPEPVAELTDHSSTPIQPQVDSDVIPLPVTRCLYEHGVPTPPPAVELLAMADDLNAHGGLDETFVAALLKAAADPLADAKRGLGIVDPEPLPVTTTKPITYESIVEALEKIAPLGPRRLDVVKLTQEQIDAVTASRPHAAPSTEPWHYFGTPVEIVETVEESTPYRLWLEQAEAEHGLKVVAELPGGAILGNPAWLVDADREFVAHVNDGVDKAAVLDAVRAEAQRPAEPTKLTRYHRSDCAKVTHGLGCNCETMAIIRGDVRLSRVSIAEPAPLPGCSVGRHIWSTTSPMRCVECRRYLRPWWRRLADRLRRRPR